MEKQLVIGKIVKPQGIRGEVKVLPYTDSAEDLLSLKRVYIDGTEYKILSARCAPDAVFLSLRGIVDRNAAELLREKELVIPRDEAPALEEGVYYIADLLGSEVVTEEGESLGTLTDVRQASTDVYTVEKDGRDTLFPVADGVVTSVDPENMRITVNKRRFQEVAVPQGGKEKR